MKTLIQDISRQVDLTRRHAVGAKRTSHPTYVNLLPPCNHSCPAGENIQAWLAHAMAGRWQPAWEQLVSDNPFPAIHGRVCYHPCEDGCNRHALDSSVSIHAVERYLGDLAQEQGWKVPTAAPTGKRILIIGAGPSGLSAAWHLARMGHQVEIHEASAIAGGMMQYGIPAYRLPRNVLAQDVERVKALGVNIVLNHKVTDLLAEKTAGNFDAVYVAIGAQAARHIEIPARDAAKVLDAVDVLREASNKQPVQLGRRVAIYGGGNTAMDAARTAKRLGADETMIIYFRDPANLEAHPFEAKEAADEGIKFKWLSSIKDISGEKITVEKMTVDAQGNASPTGEFETLEADSVVLALGQTTEIDFLRKIPQIAFEADNTIIIDESMQTGHAGIFAGGDVTPAMRSVTNAVGLGKKAAHHIHAWLNGTTWHKKVPNRVVQFEELHLPLYDDAYKAKQKELALNQRHEFEEILGGLDQKTAQHEAQRCLSCGNCYECDNCYAACPEDAIIKLGPGNGYSVNLDLCTGCEACYAQCPCHAIDMTPDTSIASTNKEDKELLA